MSEYFYPPFLFLTLSFISFAILDHVDSKSKTRDPLIGGLIVFISNGIISYFLVKITRAATNYSTTIHIISYITGIIIVTILILKEKSTGDRKTSIIIYLVPIGIALLIAKNYHETDMISADMYEKYKKQEEESLAYKKQYNFNVDSLLLKETIKRNVYSHKYTVTPPVIVYRWDENDRPTFDVDLNKSLDKRLVSFSIDSINTIITLENDLRTVGKYTNGRTSAKQRMTIIHFIDKRTLTEVTHTTVYGDEPPSSISYRHDAPAQATGHQPKKYQIVEAIEKELNSNHD